MVSHFVFRCPRTGLNVQHTLEERPAAKEQDGNYEAVICKACTGLHFINRQNGKLLGQD